MKLFVTNYPKFSGRVQLIRERELSDILVQQKMAGKPIPLANEHQSPAMQVRLSKTGGGLKDAFSCTGLILTNGEITTALHLRPNMPPEHLRDLHRVIDHDLAILRRRGPNGQARRKISHRLFGGRNFNIEPATTPQRNSGRIGLQVLKETQIGDQSRQLLREVLNGLSRNGVQLSEITRFWGRRDADVMGAASAVYLPDSNSCFFSTAFPDSDSRGEVTEACILPTVYARLHLAKDDILQANGIIYDSRALPQSLGSTNQDHSID